MDNSDLSICIDNEALYAIFSLRIDSSDDQDRYDINQRLLHNKEPDFPALNTVRLYIAA